MATDKVLIKNLLVYNIIGVDSWERVKRQPIYINICLNTDVSVAGVSDHVSNSIHYGHVAKAVAKFAEGSHFRSIEALAHAIVKICIKDFGAERALVRVEKPRALLHASAAGVEITRTKEDLLKMLSPETNSDISKGVQPNKETGDTNAPSPNSANDMIFVKDLRLSTIIGVNPWEREEKQIVIINLTLYPSFRTAELEADHVTKPHNYRTIVRTISRYIEESAYKTIEAFITAVARIALEKCHVEKITVRCEKPSALMDAESAGVEVTRDRSWLRKLQAAESQQRPNVLETNLSIAGGIYHSADIPSDYAHVSYIALGSNLGDCATNIAKALQLLETQCDCRVVNTSFLYETPPMYVTNQASFLNTTCKVLTSRSPEDLLTKLKEVESLMGRVPTIRYGPRVIDLDILLYDDIDYKSDRLIIPHALMQEREFVLRPLCDIARDFEHPKLFRTIGQLYSQLLKAQSDNPNSAPSTMHKVIPLGQNLWKWDTRTYVMGILNVTPDSFSDGGLYLSIQSAVTHAQQMVDDGADVIDIGGMSTRPGAHEIEEKEELERVIPTIQAIREAGINIPLSIDTYRASVAKAAILAGATFINDISAGRRDPDMYTTAARLGVPICLMHMRGDSNTMQSKENTKYEADDVVADVNRELTKSISSALAAGVFRWNIIVDPGIGFAKTAKHSFDILRRLGDMIGEKAPLEGFPCLSGPSKKKFIGSVTGQEDASKRGYGTAAAVTASVASGAAIVRVHDVKEMVDVVKVADVIWRKK